MMEKKLTNNLENQKKYLYLSLNSECLKSYNSTEFYIPDNDSSDALLIKNSVAYKIVLGHYMIKFTSFERTGFFDEKFDVTFGFGMHSLLQKDYFVYDGDGLKKNEMKPLENLMKKVFRRKGKFEYGDELLLDKIDLNDSAGIILYTKDAKNNVKDLGVNKKIIQFDLTKDRSEAFSEYKEFDKKVQEGKVREFEWN